MLAFSPNKTARAKSSKSYNRDSGLMILVRKSCNRRAIPGWEGVSNDTAQVKDSVRNGTARAKLKVAIARCRDRRYSYTHHLTCNDHGGLRMRFR